MIDLNKIAVISGEYSVKYSELLKRVELYAKVTPQGKETKTIILSENRLGWVYSFFAVWLQEGIAVPVDVTSTAGDIAYILRDCQPDAVWVSKEREAVLLEAIQEAGIETKVLIIDDYEFLPLAEEPTTSILPWTALSEPDNDDTAVIIYTSGTTGSPKGVMLSYANLMANIHAVSQNVPIFSQERRTLILLPLHHILPLLGTMIAPIYVGGGVAISPSLTGPDIMDTL
ncbi:MAG: AMP-binding protein, partial [Bacteroidaceae bacterium]|nr:AMP-binding protein [Bacteroidaceae bacterium]